VKVKEGSTTIADYTYNGLGQRVIKKAGDKQTVFLYDFDGQIIAEGKPDGTYTAEYIYLGNTRLAKVDIKPNDALVYYYANNYLGTPFLMTDETGAVVWEAEYKPFGQAKLNPNSKVKNNFRFAGQYFDNETGLHYNYHRYYDPKIGRYLTPDPIGFLGGDLNLFVYAGLNPINWMDPDGLAPLNNVSRITAGPNYDPGVFGGGGGFVGGYGGRFRGTSSWQGLGGWFRNLFGKPYPSKLNRVGKQQPYCPITGHYLGYDANPGLKYSPFGHFAAGFSQGWTSAKGGGVPLPPVVSSAQSWGQSLGNFLGNIF
jgi:RHS repeat-associated protein